MIHINDIYTHMIYVLNDIINQEKVRNKRKHVFYESLLWNNIKSSRDVNEKYVILCHKGFRFHSESFIVFVCKI